MQAATAGKRGTKLRVVREAPGALAFGRAGMHLTHFSMVELLIQVASNAPLTHHLEYSSKTLDNAHLFKRYKQATLLITKKSCCLIVIR